jgi:hypothetical protein
VAFPYKSIDTPISHIDPANMPYNDMSPSRNWRHKKIENSKIRRKKNNNIFLKIQKNIKNIKNT